MTEHARTARRPSGGGERTLTIGALSRATHIPVETLRTWERRYGAPRPLRKPSGHRLYPASTVEHLRRVERLLAQGHRAGQILTLPPDALEEMLELGTRSSTPLPEPVPVEGASAELARWLPCRVANRYRVFSLQTPNLKQLRVSTPGCLTVARCCESDPTRKLPFASHEKLSPAAACATAGQQASINRACASLVHRIASSLSGAVYPKSHSKQDTDGYDQLTNA